MLTRTGVALTSLAVAAALLPSATTARAATDKSGQPTDTSQPAKPTAAPKGAQQIAGGYFPAADAWPWVTSLIDLTRTATKGDFGRGRCTAVLVAPQRVLTAAHCVVGADNKTPDPASRFQVLVGRRDLSNVNQGERRNVTGVVVHPKLYLPESGVHQHHAFYDIAVLFLDQPVATTPATIGTPQDWNSWATVMGWGHYNLDHDNRQYDPYLRAADFDLLSDAKCGALFNTAQTQHFFPTIHVCAGNPPDATSFDCITHGDSGGPMMVLTNAGWRLIGITSFYPHRTDPQCGSHPGPFGFAWVAGQEMRDWPLTVAHPPVVNEGNAGGDNTGDSNPGGDNTGAGNMGGGGNTGGGATAPEPIDLTMTRSQALRYVTSMIRGETNGSIKRLRRDCTPRASNRFRCEVSWRIGRRSYSGTATFRHYEENGEVYWTYSFKGKRRQPGRSVRRVSW
jgi:hypothetical protein